MWKHFPLLHHLAHHISLAIPVLSPGKPLNLFTSFCFRQCPAFRINTGIFPHSCPIFAPVQIRTPKNFFCIHRLCYAVILAEAFNAFLSPVHRLKIPRLSLNRSPIFHLFYYSSLYIPISLTSIEQNAVLLFFCLFLSFSVLFLSFFVLFLSFFCLFSVLFLSFIPKFAIKNLKSPSRFISPLCSNAVVLGHWNVVYGCLVSGWNLNW